MGKYFVWLKDMRKGYERELVFHVCDDFGHAEEQAKPYLDPDEQIVRIDLEYEPVK